MIRRISEATMLKPFPGIAKGPAHQASGPGEAVNGLYESREVVAGVFREAQVAVLEDSLNSAKGHCALADKCQLELVCDAGEGGDGRPYEAIFHCPLGQDGCGEVVSTAAKSAEDGIPRSLKRVLFLIKSQQPKPAPQK